MSSGDVIVIRWVTQSHTQHDCRGMTGRCRDEVIGHGHQQGANNSIDEAYLAFFKQVSGTILTPVYKLGNLLFHSPMVDIDRIRLLDVGTSMRRKDEVRDV